MLKNNLLFLALLSLLCSECSGITLSSNDFCKLAEPEKCSQRNAPHVFQCGASMCAKNETDCKEYTSVHEKLKYKGLFTFIDAMTSRKYSMHLRLQQNFKSLRSKINKCSLTSYQWQPSDMCMRGRNCFQKKITNAILNVIFRIKKVSCPCPANKPYVCGKQKNVCSLNREACDSFTKNQNSTAWIPQPNVIKKCSAESDFIKTFRF